MSTRRSPTKKTAKRSPPAKSSRDADSRWGFCGQAKSLQAFTAEHLAADVAAGVVIDGGRLGAMLDQNCPRRFAEECRPGLVPTHYRSTRSRTIVDTAGDRPRRWRDEERTICFDCRSWHWWRERREFNEDFGDDREGGGYARGRSIADAGDVDRAMAAQHVADQQMIAGVGELDEPLEWFDLRMLAASIRRCLQSWSRVTPRRPAEG